MQDYISNFLLLIARNPKKFILSFLTSHFPQELITNINVDTIQLDYLENENYFQIDFFMFACKNLIQIQFSNHIRWLPSQNLLQNNFEQSYQSYLFYHFPITSYHEVEQIKRKIFP